MIMSSQGLRVVVLLAALSPHALYSQGDPDSLTVRARDSIPAADSLALTDAEIREAIAWGEREKKPYAYLYGPIAGGVAGALFSASGLAPSVVAMGPFGRVATEAATAKRRYIKYDQATVSKEALTPALIVRIEPPKPSSDRSMRGRQPMRIDHVVLQAAIKGADAIQPLTTREEEFQWQNGFGATFSGMGLTATFALRDIPEGDFDIVMITSTGEEKAFVGKKHRLKLR